MCSFTHENHHCSRCDAFLGDAQTDWVFCSRAQSSTSKYTLVNCRRMLAKKRRERKRLVAWDECDWCYGNAMQAEMQVEMEQAEVEVARAAKVNKKRAFKAQFEITTTTTTQEETTEETVGKLEGGYMAETTDDAAVLEEVLADAHGRSFATLVDQAVMRARLQA